MTDTENVVYYSDSFAPVLPVDVLQVATIMKAGLAGKKESDYNRVEYALWEDTATWGAWLNWAQQNAYDGNTGRGEKFSGRAIRIEGRWETMAEGDKSFMCIQDASSASPKGAICVEANLTGDPVSTYDTKTYSITNAGLSILTDFKDSPVLDSQDFFTGKTEAVLKAEDPASPENWKSFEVLNCEITTVKITCMNWVRSTDGAEDGGYANWAAEQSVKFWWFDGRDISETVTRFPVLDYDKIQSEAKSLEITYSGAMYALFGSTLSALVASFLIAF